MIHRYVLMCWFVTQCVLIATSAVADPVAEQASASPQALMVVEQHRGSVVQRIVGDWRDVLPTLPRERALTAQQLSEALWTLRADRLLAASLAGSFAAIESILADDRADRAPLQHVGPKNLGDATTDLTYTPVNPCRIADTRVSGGALAANTGRTFNGFAASFAIQGGTATNCGMPNGVAAIAMNVYAVNPTNLGFIKVYPANGAEPAVSTVNYQTGIVAIATGAIVPVDGANSNRFIAKSSAQVDFIADVVGYFRAPAKTFFLQGGNAFGATAVLGTTDNNAFDIRVNGSRVMRFEPNPQSPSTIGGNGANRVTAGAWGAAVGGGGVNATSVTFPSYPTLPIDCNNPAGGGTCANLVTDAFGTIAGGFGNQAGDGTGATDSVPGATVGGGVNNVASSFWSTIAGGFSNTASGSLGTVSGGSTNSASGSTSTVGGGYNNIASGDYATVAGGYNNTASAAYSFAAGFGAQADGTSCFAFSNWTSGSGGCLGQPNVARFTLDHGLSVDYYTRRADGGGTRWVYFGDLNAGKTLLAWNGAYLTDAGVWVNASSSKDGKTDFAAVDSDEVLSKVARLPITTWRYKEGEGGVRHIGPMAEDFDAAFNVGYGPHTIADLDARGVALAAIQGLNAKLDARNAELGTVRAELAELRRVVEELRARTAPNGSIGPSR